MGLIGLLELSGITLHGLPLTAVECRFRYLDAAEPDVVLDGGARDRTLATLFPRTLNTAQPALVLDVAAPERIVQCP